MNAIRDKIVAEALSWSGTKYHEQQGVKGVGVDCLHLPLRVYQAVGLVSNDFEVPYYSPQEHLSSGFEVTKLLDAIKGFSQREITEEEVQPGDMIVWGHTRRHFVSCADSAQATLGNGQLINGGHYENSEQEVNRD